MTSLICLLAVLLWSNQIMTIDTSAKCFVYLDDIQLNENKI